MSKKHEVRSTLQKQKLLFTEFVDLLHLGITFLWENCHEVRLPSGKMELFADSKTCKLLLQQFPKTYH